MDSVLHCRVNTIVATVAERNKVPHLIRPPMGPEDDVMNVQVIPDLTTSALPVVPVEDLSNQ